MTTSLADFDRFWTAYPRQQGIGAARRQWIWALSAAGNDARGITEAATRYATYCRREGVDPRFIPMPAKWLADERWKDVLPEPPRKPGDGQSIARAKIIAAGQAYLLRAQISDVTVRQLVTEGYLAQDVADREWFRK